VSFERRVSPATQVLRCCEKCGHPIDDEEKVLELAGVQIAGNALIFQGYVRTLLRGSVVLMRSLMVRQRLSKEAFFMLANSDAERSTANTYVCYLRKALLELNTPLVIVTVRGWGYELLEK
jgi:DNA-binding response OmpR family regulator